MGLKEQKEEIRKSELEQANLWGKIRLKERQAFKEVDLISIIARTKNNDDLSLLIEKFTDWSIATKDDSKKNKIYIDLLQAIYRIHSYCFNIETTVSQAIVMAKTSEEISNNTAHSSSKEKLQYITKIKLLEEEVSSLKGQIEFAEKNG